MRTRLIAVLCVPLLAAVPGACGPADAPPATGSGTAPARGSTGAGPAGSSPADPGPTGSGPTSSGPTGPGSPAGSTAPGRAEGEPAVWVLGPGQSPQPSSTGFTALVTRLDCNGGITGQVLPPRVSVTGSQVVVTFSVAAKLSDAATCQGNDQVPYTVELGQPLRGRALVDGHCLPGQPGANTSFCVPTGVRFTP